MKIPNVIKLHELNLKVQYSDLAIDKTGLSDYEQETIIIKSDMTEGATFTTFLHEYLHVVLSETGLDQRLLPEDEDEEVLVSVLAGPLASLFRQLMEENQKKPRFEVPWDCCYCSMSGFLSPSVFANHVRAKHGSQTVEEAISQKRESLATGESRT